MSCQVGGLGTRTGQLAGSYWLVGHRLTAGGHGVHCRTVSAWPSRPGLGLRCCPRLAVRSRCTGSSRSSSGKRMGSHAGEEAAQTLGRMSGSHRRWTQPGQREGSFPGHALSIPEGSDSAAQPRCEALAGVCPAKRELCPPSDPCAIPRAPYTRAVWAELKATPPPSLSQQRLLRLSCHELLLGSRRL